MKKLQNSTTAHFWKSSVSGERDGVSGGKTQLSKNVISPQMNLNIRQHQSNSKYLF